MSLFQLVLHEIWFSRANFLAGMLAIMLIVSAMLIVHTVLAAHDDASETILKEKEDATRKRMTDMEEKYRTIVTSMGVSATVLPKGQKRAGFYAEGFSQKRMPHTWADSLRRAGTDEIHAVIPILREKTFWNERHRTIMLTGVGPSEKHDSTFATPARKIDHGALAVGFELHESHNLNAGDSVAFNGRRYAIQQCIDQKGGIEDITVWMRLDDAQRLLSRPGQASELWVWGVPSKEGLEEAIHAVLPEVQVISEAPREVMRLRTLKTAEAMKLEAIARDQNSRAEQRQRRKRLMLVFGVVSVGAAMAWSAVLNLINVNSRIREIGIFRAIGFTSGAISRMVIARAFFMGFTGVILGLLLWMAVTGFFFDGMFDSLGLSALVLICAGPLLTAAGAIAPALHATRQDPAESLNIT